jgi:hypothetical protein
MKERRYSTEKSVVPYQNDIKRNYELLEWFEAAKQERLLRRQEFVPKSVPFSFGPKRSKCEAGALTTELTAPVRAYSTTNSLIV